MGEISTAGGFDIYVICKTCDYKGPHFALTEPVTMDTMRADMIKAADAWNEAA
jgi:hypothetical protein